jgi:esterase/lipase superfamily enzyme
MNLSTAHTYDNQKELDSSSPLGKLLAEADSKVAGLNFFNSIMHDGNAAGTMAGAQEIKFFTDRPVSNEKGYIEFLPASRNPGQLDSIKMGQVSITDARVLPTALASPQEETEHRNSNTTAHLTQLYGNEEEFLKSIEQASKDSPDHKVAVMIPGFPMTHDQGIATAANLQAESGIPVVLYSWPSQDKPLISAYKGDEKKDELSLALHGNKIINDIANRIGAENMVLIGFSQGGKMAIQAAIARQKETRGAKPFFAQAFSRADGPALEFQENITPILKNAEHTVVLASPKDRLLLGSAFMLQHEQSPFFPAWRTGSITKYKIPPELTSRFQVIDDSSSNNGTTNHIFNTHEIAHWLKSLK